MNSFFEKFMRCVSIITIGALLMTPQESLGMAAFKGLFKDMFRDVKLTKALSESIEKSFTTDVEKSLGKGLEAARAFKPETLKLNSAEALKAVDTFKSASEAARKDLLSFKPDAEFTAKLKDEFAFKEVEPGEVLDRFNGKIDEIATAKISAAADELLKTGNKLVEDGEKLAKVDPEKAAKLKADGNALKTEANNINEGLISSKKAFTEFKAKAETQFKALSGAKEVGQVSKSGETVEENAAKQKAATDPSALAGTESFLQAVGEGKGFRGKLGKVALWGVGIFMGGLGFSFWNFVQARIERTQAHVAEIATACLPQYFGGFWFRIPDEFINLADPSRSIPVYAPIVDHIQPNKFKQEMATGIATEHSAGAAAFFYGATDDTTVRDRINESLFNTDNKNADEFLDMNNLFVTAGANRGNYCGQLGWGAETIFSPYFGRRMLHLPTGLEFYSTGKAIDPKYPLRQIFGDSLGISNCDTTIETYVGGEFANMIESGAPATVQYDMYNHNGTFYATGGKAGIDGEIAKAFVEKYVLAKEGKTLLDLPDKNNTTPRQRLMSASVALGAFNLQQVQEIDAATWPKLFGVKVKRSSDVTLQSPLSGYGYCVYQTADTKYIQDVRKAVQSKSANVPVDRIVDYVVPLMSAGADVAPAIVPVIHGKERGETTPGFIQWEQNPRIKYLYSLVSGHRYNVTTGAQESTTIGSTIESNALVSGAIKDSAGQDTLLGLQVKATKSLLSESFAGKFIWNNFAIERILPGANNPYVFRVYSMKNADGTVTKTTLPIGKNKQGEDQYLDDFVVPVNFNLEAVDISSADLHYFVSLVTSKIYDAQLAEVSEKVNFAFARTQESSTPSSSFLSSSDKQTPTDTMVWGDQLLDPKALADSDVLVQGTTALGTLFTEWSVNPFNQDKLSPAYIGSALIKSFSDKYKNATSDIFSQLVAINAGRDDKKSISDDVIKAFAGRILNALRSTGLTIRMINNVIKRPLDSSEAIEAIKTFAQKFADKIVSNVLDVFNKQKPQAKNITNPIALKYLQDLIGKENELTWRNVWQAAINKKQSIDFSTLTLNIFRSIDDTTWKDALNQIASPSSQTDWNWEPSPDPKNVEKFNKVGDNITTLGIYSFYSDIADQGLISFPKMYLYKKQQQLAKTASNDSPTGSLAATIKWPSKDPKDPVAKSCSDYYDYLIASKAGIISLVGPFAFSQKQIPNILITAIDETHPVYTSSDYPGDYFIVTNDTDSIRKAESFNILAPQTYLVSLFTGNIYQRDDTTGAVAPKWDVQDIKQARVPSNTLKTIINNLALPADLLTQLNPAQKKGNWVTYAGRRLYLDPRDDQSGAYVYQDITNVPNIAAWETARKSDEFTGVTDFLIGFTKVSQSGDSASVAYGAPLSSTPDLISLVTQATYTNTGAPGTLAAQQDPFTTAFGKSLRGEVQTQIAKLRTKAKEEKTEKGKETEAVQEKPLGSIVNQLSGASQFSNSPFSSLYQPSSGKFYSVMKMDDTIVGFTDFSFTSAANPKACGIGYYDSTGAFGSALFGEDAQYVRATQGLFGTGCSLTLGVPFIIPAITFADMISAGKEAQLKVGSKPGNLKFTYDGLYPGTYKFYQFTYPLRASSKGKDVAMGLGVVAQYTPQGGSTSYYIEMSSGNVFATNPFKTETITRKTREFVDGKWVEKTIQQQVGSYQPEIAHYPILTAIQDKDASKDASMVSVSYDASSNPRIFAQGIDGYYYQATYDKDNNDGDTLNTVVPPAGEAISAYRFYNGAQAFNASVQGEPHYFNAFAPKVSLQAFTASDGSSMAGKTVIDLNSDNVSKSSVNTYAYNGTEAMRQYKYIGSTKVTFGSMPPAFSSEFAKTENTHSQLFQFDTGLFVKGKRNQFDNPSMIFVPAIMTDMSATSTANASGFMACTLDKDKQVYAPIAPADATDAAFKAQFKIYNLQQNNRHYVVVVCQANDQVEAHYYMPMYEVIDTITRNAVQDIIGMYAITTSSGDNLLVQAIDKTKADWRPIKYIFGVPAELESGMETYIQRQAFFNERVGSYSYDEKTGIIKPSADFINRYFYNLSPDDLSDKKPSYFVGQPVAQFVDLYSGVLFAPQANNESILRPVGNLTRADLEALLTAKGVRPPDPFEDPSLYRPMSDTVYNPATKKTEERYVESAVGANGRVAVPEKGFDEKTPFMYCVPSAVTTPTDSGSQTASSSSSSSSSSGSSSGFSWENMQEPSSSTAA